MKELKIPFTVVSSHNIEDTEEYPFLLRKRKVGYNYVKLNDFRFYFGPLSLLYHSNDIFILPEDMHSLVELCQDHPYEVDPREYALGRCRRLGKREYQVTHINEDLLSRNAKELIKDYL